MRKRDKIKGYLPYFTGGLYLLVLELIVDKIGINTEIYLLPLVLIWVLLTVVSVIVLEEGIDLFDKNHDNENEEGD